MAVLACQISLGLFTGEVAVRGKDADGNEFSLFVSDEFVEYSAPVGSSGSTTGWLCVDVLAREGNLVLVRLPAQTFENGQTVTVRDSQIELRLRRETV